MAETGDKRTLRLVKALLAADDACHAAKVAESEAFAAFGKACGNEMRAEAAARAEMAAAMREPEAEVSDTHAAYSQACTATSKAEAARDKALERLRITKTLQRNISKMATVESHRGLDQHLMSMDATLEDRAVALAILTTLIELGQCPGRDGAPIARDKIAEIAGVKPTKVTSSAEKLVEWGYFFRKAGQAFPVGRSRRKDKDDDFRRRHTVYGFGHLYS